MAGCEARGRGGSGGGRGGGAGTCSLAGRLKHSPVLIYVAVPLRTE